MNKGKLTIIMAVILALAAGGVYLAVNLGRQPVSDPLVQPGTPPPPTPDQAVAMAPVIEGAPVTATEPETTDLDFEGTVKLGQPLKLNVRFRDHSQLPKDYANYEQALAQLPGIPGQVTLVFDQFKAVDKITVLPVRPGTKYFYVTYSLSGDPDNPSGPQIQPSQPYSRGQDLAPQPVLIVGNQVFPSDGQSLQALQNFLGLTNPTHMKYDQAGPWHFGGIWARPADRLPLIAVEYVNAEGQRKLVRLDYSSADQAGD